jgi:NADPH-dependent 2,4-dienoyl-CoA reductase/sulfur reductase-like enzyme
VIIGAGAAGAACADKLREKGYAGPITLVGGQDPIPVDRPNLSKDYLAGTAAEEWIPLRTAEYYESTRIELVGGDPAVRILPSEHQVTLRSGRTLEYGALLLATGAEARTLSLDGSDRPNVYRLRTLADSKAIIETATRVRSCAVIGSSFIGLEVAASLRHRGLEVSVISQDSIPLGKVLGAELGHFVQKIHAEHGVRFLSEHDPASNSR